LALLGFDILPDLVLCKGLGSIVNDKRASFGASYFGNEFGGGIVPIGLIPGVRKIFRSPHSYTRTCHNDTLDLWAEVYEHIGPVGSKYTKRD
jgi:hypothetical protein